MIKQPPPLVGAERARLSGHLLYGLRIDRITLYPSGSATSEVGVSIPFPRGKPRLASGGPGAGPHINEAPCSFLHSAREYFN